MPGKITVFTTAGCSQCDQVKALLAESGATEVDVREGSDWRPLLFLLTKGRSTPPCVFFNATFKGSLTEMQRLKARKALKVVVSDCLNEQNPPPFPPQLRTPEPTEYFQIVPPGERDRWQSYIDELCVQLSRGAKQVELVLMMMDTPANKMVVVCSAGAASSQFKIGQAGADKKPDGTEEKLYCQMVMEERKTFYFDDPSNLPTELKSNIDLIKYGYGYYIGAPWSVKNIRGTIVSLEKEAGILKKEHVPILEKVRDKIESEWHDYISLTGL